MSLINIAVIVGSLRRDSFMPHGLTGRVRFPASRPASSACRAALSARRSRSSIHGEKRPARLG